MFFYLEEFSQSDNLVVYARRSGIKSVAPPPLLLNSFPMNGDTYGFCTWSQKLENDAHSHLFDLLTPDRTKSKIKKFSK